MVLLALAATAAPVAAEDRWSVTFGLGGQLPDLAPLSEGLFKSPLVGNAVILVQEGGLGTGVEGEDVDENETEVLPFRYDNDLPEIGISTLGSIEFKWHANERHAFVFGMSSLEKTAINRVSGQLPLQQHFASNTVNSERRGKISFTEYNVGWQYNFWRRPDYRLFTRLSLHEVFDIDFREDFIFLFVESPIEDLVGVRRDMVVEAQTASLLMGQMGLGGEWFARDWLSFSAEAGFLLGEREFQLRDVRIRDDFISGDSVRLNGLPYRQMSDGTLGYLLPSATADDVEDADTREQFYRRMNLKFDGWRFMFRVNLYF